MILQGHTNHCPLHIPFSSCEEQLQAFGYCPGLRCIGHCRQRTLIIQLRFQAVRYIAFRTILCSLNFFILPEFALLFHFPCLFQLDLLFSKIYIALYLLNYTSLDNYWSLSDMLIAKYFCFCHINLKTMLHDFYWEFITTKFQFFKVFGMIAALSANHHGYSIQSYGTNIPKLLWITFV